MTPPVVLCLASLALVAAPLRAQAADTITDTSVRAGVYRAEQAQRGAAVFRRACVDCHAVAQFREPQFLAAWTGSSARALFELIRTQMPQDNPGSLRRAEYAEVLAYLLELNGLPAGDRMLGADDTLLARIRIEASLP